MSGQISEQQIRFFHTFGYLVVRQAFTAEEMTWITADFENAIRTFGEGEAHDGSKRTMFGAPAERTPRLCTLIDHPAVKELAAAALGEDFNYASGDGNYYAGDTGWHPDGNWGELFACKIAFYLDPLTADTGCLRVIPGSQRKDHFVRSAGIEPNRSQELYGVPPRDFPGQLALETVPGDLVIFNHDLYHASFGGGSRRRMFTMNLTRHCSSEADMALLRSYVSVHSPGGYGSATGAGMYMPLVLDTATEDRMSHLVQCAQMHDELFPQFARAPGSKASL